MEVEMFKWARLAYLSRIENLITVDPTVLSGIRKEQDY